MAPPRLRAPSTTIEGISASWHGRDCATAIPATTSSAPATASAVTCSSRISAPSASAPNGMIIEMKETVTVGSSRSRTVIVTNVKAVPNTAR